MQVIREFGDFYKDALHLLGQEGYEELVAAIAINSLAGVVMAGTGGFRKLRWNRPGTGKSGGVRTIYYFADTHCPISLLAIYGKNEKANLSHAERNELQKIAAILKEEGHVRKNHR